MWSKSGTTIMLALFLIITPTLSSSSSSSCPGKNVPEILKYYDLPGGLIPDDVNEFTCTPLDPEAKSAFLAIELKRPCAVILAKNYMVVDEDAEYKIVMEFKTTLISANVSRGSLIKIMGEIAAVLSIQLLPLSRDVIIYKQHLVLDKTTPFGDEDLLFFSTNGDVSIPFPVEMFPATPPPCDHSTAGVAVAKNKQETPKWVPAKYGRLMPLFAHLAV